MKFSQIEQITAVIDDNSPLIWSDSIDFERLRKYYENK